MTVALMFRRQFATAVVCASTAHLCAAARNRAGGRPLSCYCHGPDATAATQPSCTRQVVQSATLTTARTARNSPRVPSLSHSVNSNRSRSEDAPFE